MTIAIVDRLFAKFAARYGAKWTSQWTDSDLMKLARNEWFEGLQHFEVGDIKRGLDSWRENWPPNIVEFKKECMPAPYYREYRQKALSAPSNKNKGRAALLKIKEMLA